MSCNCSQEVQLVKAKHSKSGKKSSKCCPSVCKTDCCVEECILDCCTPAFQRLDKVRNGWALVAATGTGFLNAESAGPGVLANISTRTGQAVPIPNEALFETVGGNGGVALANGAPSGLIDIVRDNAYWAYVFVNTIRYASYEACGKMDQVSGWYVNTATENLEIFQDLPELNLTTHDNRDHLLGVPSADMTKVQKNKLNSLNILYKLSLKAIEKVGASPREEGTIVEVHDKCGQKWTVAVNSAKSISNLTNTEFVIVAVPSC